MLVKHFKAKSTKPSDGAFAPVYIPLLVASLEILHGDLEYDDCMCLGNMPNDLDLPIVLDALQCLIVDTRFWEQSFPSLHLHWDGRYPQCRLARDSVRFSAG